MLQADRRVVRQHAGGEQLQCEADASGREGQSGRDEDGTERPQLHDHPEEAVEPSGQPVHHMEQGGLEARDAGVGGDEATGRDGDRAHPEPKDVTWVPGALDVRSGGHPHVWIVTPFDSFSKAESTGQVVRRHGLELLTEPGDPGGPSRRPHTAAGGAGRGRVIRRRTTVSGRDSPTRGQDSGRLSDPTGGRCRRRDSRRSPLPRSICGQRPRRLDGVEAEPTPTPPCRRGAGWWRWRGCVGGGTWRPSGWIGAPRS